MRHKYAAKRQWVLDRLQAKYDQRMQCGDAFRTSITASDDDDQRAWAKAFGGQEIAYTLGANISPDFARTLRRMHQAGELARVTGGNQGARLCGQKTYYVSYVLAPTE